MLGLIGGPLIILSGIGVLFDLYEAGSPVQGIVTIPEFLWELSLGIYLHWSGASGRKPCSPSSPGGREEECHVPPAAGHPMRVR